MKKTIIILFAFATIGCNTSEEEIARNHPDLMSKDSALKLISKINSMYDNALIGWKRKHIDDSLQVLNYEKYYDIVSTENEKQKDTIEDLRYFIDSHTKFNH